MTEVGVVGLGLIGGSLGQALKRVRRGGRRAYKVVGFARNAASAREARRSGACDAASFDVSVLAHADIVVLAVPVQSIGAVVKKIAPVLKRGAVLTDVGSVKGAVLKGVRRALVSRRDVSFVGAHPIAGSEKSGLKNADPRLFVNATCVIDSARSSAAIQVARLWSSVGAKTLRLSARDHDRFLAATSHLPHLLAFSLFSDVTTLAKSHSSVRSLVAGSFRDMTRIAASNPDVWLGIFESNRNELARSWKSFRKTAEALLRQKGPSLRRTLASLSSAREKWTSR